MYQFKDCDGDGILDHVCEYSDDSDAGLIVISSENECYALKVAFFYCSRDSDNKGQSVEMVCTLDRTTHVITRVHSSRNSRRCYFMPYLLIHKGLLR